MKILHVLDWYRPFGGAERLLFGMLDVLEKAGHENIVIANDAPGQKRTSQRTEYFLKNIEVNFADVPRLSIFARAPWIEQLRGEVSQIIERHKPDVAHFHNMQNPFVLRAVTRALPSVRSIHDPRLYCFTNWRLLPDQKICPYPMGRRCLTEGCIPRNPLGTSSAIRQIPYKYLHFRAHRHVDVLIAESLAVRDCLLQNGFPQEQLALLPNMTQTYGSWEEVSRFNAQHHDPSGKTILFVGRASYEKGIDYLVEAMARVPKPWNLILVTGGDHLAKVREKVRFLGIEDSVEMPGILNYEDTRTCYARADVVVFPSVWIESFGLVGLEAMANGKPVVAFRTGGISDWLEDQRTGFLVSLKDTEGLAGKIQQLLEDPSLAREMGKNGYERVVRHFNEEIYLKGLLGIYESAMRKKSSRRAKGPAA
jgi:glycosyltransferase involved in cell wall biosynthesis